ncbi:UDP-N-acetylmuramoyl-L-alanyl-D-glutamate--2,6-diaminopimelate ligase [Woeseia oceani]|uniref:UDP-N-acetylmuramoyl-L-alanyl-D-glutamate--2, 6-diaminopimelate ligase n=1 Tax=Woeseia oceani TaxID=1548547 RepID=UPI0009F2EC02|nr:UDP-N-acetylmuramoyl-L-alanyl-D-glutamate--2,6-diaminopimelate ligase [Woeseia oceani]
MSMPAESITLAPTLADLLAGFAAAPAIPVAGIASDSRRLQSGDVFLAVRGKRSHGLEHLDEKLAATLAAIVWDGDESVVPPAGVTTVVVRDLAAKLGDIANRWFGAPSAAIKVCGVTGTNGKTTVAWLLAQSWQLLGERCGYIGTLGTGIDEINDDYGLTTPDCVELHRQFARFRDAGAARAALEVSSHALTQGRLNGVQVDAALFTNLSRDHIDYHGDMAAYGDSKARLFTEFSPQHQVVCIDSEFGLTLAARCGSNAILVASRAVAEAGDKRYVFAETITPQADGTCVQVMSSWGEGQLVLPLYGQFNVANALQVIALLLSSGVPFATALEVMQAVEAPPGRLQQVTIPLHSELPAVFVDYAHTPAALEAALTALAPHCRGKLWCVFGCGGDRDKGKRPQMGAIAERCADKVILTSDNPRSEDPLAIMRDAQHGMSGAEVAIEDRASAIAFAIAQASTSDVILIAGKGHENYQIIGEQRLPFSDYQVARQNLQQRCPA